MRTWFLYILATILFAVGLYFKYSNLKKMPNMAPIKVVDGAFRPLPGFNKKPEIKKKEIPKPKSLDIPKTSAQSRQKVVEKSFDDFYEDHQEPVDSEGNIYVSTLTVIGDQAIAHGDILIGDTESVNQQQRDGKPIVISPPDLWEEGKIPFVIESNLDPQVASEARAVMDTITSLSNVEFLPRTNEKDYIIFKRTDVHCFTYVGKVGGAQPVFLSDQCFQSQISHELMHTLGFHHEQSRMDRDDHLEILWENIEEDFHSQFRKFPWKHLDLERFPFDYNSIMLYPPTAFAVDQDSLSIIKINGEVYEPAFTLSPQDIDRINAIYKAQNN